MTFERVKVGSISNFHNSKRKPVTKADRQPGDIPYYGAAGIQDYVADYIFDGHYVLVGEDGTVLQPGGKPTLQNIKGKSWVNNHAHVLSSNNTDDTDFLFYSLGNEDITAFVTGAVQMKLNMGNLKDVEIYWPNESRSRSQIVRVLRQFDEKIALNSKISSQLEQIAQTIFKSWFVDFEPVHAKARGEQPEGMDSETAALFPDSFEDSELGPIPAGWAVRPSAEIFDFSIGRTPPRKEPKWFCEGGNGVPWVSIRDMGKFGVYTALTDEGLHEDAISKFRVPVAPAGTVLMSFKLTLGRVAISRIPLTTNEAIAHFIPRESDSLPSEFAYLWLKNLDYTGLDSTSSIGTATNSSLVKKIRFLQPPTQVIESFDAVCKPMFEQIKNLTHQSEALGSIRDSLLPRLISGELEIPEELLGE